jgi:trehalose-6-phosphatase
VPGVGWSYFGADPDWGEKQAIQLKLDLEAALANYDVKIVSENTGNIEIVPTGFTKGSMVQAVFDRVLAFRAGLLPTFTFVIGDEASDDSMFDAFYELVASSPSAAGSLNLRGFTVCVGPRPGTSAALYANDVKDVEHVLTAIATAHTVAPPVDNAMTGAPGKAA